MRARRFPFALAKKDDAPRLHFHDLDRHVRVDIMLHISGTMVADANLHMILLRCESCDAAVHLVLCGKKPSHFHSIGRRGHARLSQVLLTDNI